MPETKVTFEKDAIEGVLEVFDKEVDEDGYIVESESGERILDREGENIKKDELGGVKKGSEIFLNDNFSSLVDFVKRHTRR
ncbi:MAG: hypothetical protein ABEJ56_01555 [Candidatus Nanohaloarchaea archaeon]